MEELENLTQDGVLELITDFPLEPLRNKLIITTNIVENEDDDINLSGQSFSEVQYVMAAGSHRAEFTAGQKVKSVKYSVLYMKAIKALQEAQTRIETLETKVQALEDA